MMTYLPTTKDDSIITIKRKQRFGESWLSLLTNVLTYVRGIYSRQILVLKQFCSFAYLYSLFKFLVEKKMLPIYGNSLYTSLNKIGVMLRDEY